MKINKFKKEKDKYKIYLDDGNVIETYEDVILQNNLLLKKEITKEQLEKIIIKTEYSKIYHKIQNLIGIKYRSEKWVKDYFKKNTDLPNEKIEEMINNLKNNNFINDERYAKAYIHDKINLTLDGPYKVINELKKENIDATDIALELYTNDILEERIIKIINKKCKENKKYMGYILEKRISDYLKNMGYSIEDINEYKHLITANNNIIEKEFEKAYKKYSKKLKDENLKIKIKQVLYTYGINSEEIEDMLNKKALEEN